MEKDKYLKERLDNQINWYSKKSTYNKNLYHCLQGLVIFLAALIPFLSGYSDDIGDNSNLIIGCIGLVVSILTGLLALYKFQEKWAAYRTTSETLKHEKFLFETNTEPYNNEKDNFQLLVKRIEHVISKENSEWVQYIVEKQKSKSKPL